ncbi:E3 ubiquitin-protein ligase TRIM21 isoform X1 [Thunnus maccoyii]|uniref:E3 ubiquitin-protein ligase TRIM21 isoform X1 n=2 Tax=Thunnus maccoyii TaxID=8240 RepID=UPI001C4C031D|nr:E3 ubiquitin-protein ligase TRIM21 isoform X1 [Thunnus maccoyii]
MSVWKEVLRYFTAVKVPIQQYTNTPLQVKVLHEESYYSKSSRKKLTAAFTCALVGSMMMAEAATSDLFSEQELTCSICLDLFSEPVSTPCGHNFCQACIGGYWASSPVCTCPLCKRQFDERPRLSVNRVFSLIADKYKVARYGAAGLPVPVGNGMPTGAMVTDKEGSSTNPFLTGAASGEEVVWCDVCTGVKQPAISSCLTCTASYCAEHVRPHHSTPFYAKHPLMDPQEALRGRTCAIHHRLLEVYCRTCQRCICAICVLEEHRTHKTVSVQTERQGKQKQVARTEQEILNRIKEKEIHVTELKRKLQGVKNYADGERGEVEHLLDELSSSLDRIRSQVVGGIENQLDAVMSKGEGLVSRLEVELSQLMDRRATLEVQAISQDHIGFLQSFEEATAPLAEDQQDEVDEDSSFSLHFQLGDVKSALTEVKEKMDDIRMGEVRSRGSRSSRGSFSSGEVMLAAESMLSLRASNANLRKSHWSLRDLKKHKPVSGHKKARVYMEDVTLNPVTAYPFLILSEDRKQVKRGEKLQFYRNSQHRFDVWSCVIAKEGFSSGRHYWEVCVGENKDWKLGVVRESAQKKGLFDMSPSNGYYAIWWSGSQLRALTSPPLTKVKHPPKLRQVGVFLDMDEGQVSFYNVKSGSEIYSFTGSSEFTERMFPLLGTGDKEVPLVLMTSQHHLA